MNQATESNIKKRIKEEFGADVVEIISAFPVDTYFHAYSENRTFIGRLTDSGGLSLKPIEEEK